MASRGGGGACNVGPNEGTQRRQVGAAAVAMTRECWEPSLSRPFLSALAHGTAGRRRVRSFSFSGGRFWRERSPAASRPAGNTTFCTPPLVETPVLGAGRRRLSALEKPGAQGGGPQRVSRRPRGSPHALPAVWAPAAPQT